MFAWMKWNYGLYHNVCKHFKSPPVLIRMWFCDIWRDVCALNQERNQYLPFGRFCRSKGVACGPGAHILFQNRGECAKKMPVPVGAPGAWIHNAVNVICFYRLVCCFSVWLCWAARLTLLCIKSRKSAKLAVIIVGVGPWAIILVAPCAVHVLVF